MSMTLTIRDEEMNGETLNEFVLDFLTEKITVRELIRSRVYQEVKDHNTKQNQTNFRGLVQPTDAERTLNGYRLKQPRQIEWKTQFEKAVEAFEKSQILILVNGQQLDSLEDEIEVGPSTTVTFLRLTLLVGG
jgi:RNA polymerase-interacting CarD/CdnL/TRCF family regulator